MDRNAILQMSPCNEQIPVKSGPLHYNNLATVLLRRQISKKKYFEFKKLNGQASLLFDILFS